MAATKPKPQAKPIDEDNNFFVPSQYLVLVNCTGELNNYLADKYAFEYGSILLWWKIGIQFLFFDFTFDVELKY